MTKKYTTTSQTVDPDAKMINLRLNDVSRMIEVGKMLKDLLEGHFFSNLKAFKRYIRMNIDKDEKSCLRYMALAENADKLNLLGIIRLTEAYNLLGIADNKIDQEIE